MRPSLTQARRRATVAAAVPLSLILGAGVLLAPQLADAAATRIATDGFDRSSASGWGSSPAGGSWSVEGGTGSSVGSSLGVVRGVAAGRSLRASVPASAADVAVRAAFTAPSVKEFYYSVEGRLQANGDSYRGRARIDANRKLHVEVMHYRTAGAGTILGQTTLPTTVAAGQIVSVELEVVGTAPVTVRAKTYLNGAVASNWQISKTDTSAGPITAAGKVGVHAYNSAGNAATNISTRAFSADRLSGVAAPTPPPTTPTPPSPAPPTTPTTGRGSAAVGTTSYAVPANAVFVSPSGNDAAGGTGSAPVKTITKAIAKTKAGGTIVLRGGTYREYFIIPPGKNITIQSYPKEAVWFDGSKPVDNFAASGSVWRADGFTPKFDSSPTFSKGAPDGTAAGWQFVNPARPMAAHPDAIWINGAEQKQVGSLGQVTAGTFFVDYGANRLYLGSNPSGKTVEASALPQAVSMRAPGAVIRGIGFRRFGDSVWMQGAITTYYDAATLENVVVRDSATAGIGLFGKNCVLRNVTVIGSGQIGVQGQHADGLVADNLSLVNNNDEGFNPAPSAGGFKLGSTRGITLKNSEILNTTGNSVWFDESSYGIDLINNTIQNGTRWGIILEISSGVTVADNLISGNAYDGLGISDTDNVAVWNNTIVNNGKASIALVQDVRRITNLAVPGHDSRRAQPDMSMPWITRNVVLGNNIMTGKGTTDPILRVHAYDKAFSGNEMLAASNGNIFSQTGAGSVKDVVVWSKKSANPIGYTTFGAYQSATGYDKASYNLIAASPVDSSFAPVSAVSSRESSVAQALPASVAAKIGQASGTRHLGYFR